MVSGYYNMTKIFNSYAERMARGSRKRLTKSFPQRLLKHSELIWMLI